MIDLSEILKNNILLEALKKLQEKKPMPMNNCPMCGSKPSMMLDMPNNISFGAPIAFEKNFRVECLGCRLTTKKHSQSQDAIIEWNEMTEGMNK